MCTNLAAAKIQPPALLDSGVLGTMPMPHRRNFRPHFFRAVFVRNFFHGLAGQGGAPHSDVNVGL